MLDGVFAEGDDGILEFHAAEAPSDEEVARLLATIIATIEAADVLGKILGHLGLPTDPPAPLPARPPPSLPALFPDPPG